MFLDEKIVSLVLENKPKNDNEFKELTQKVVNLCFDRIIELFAESKSDADVIPNLKKVCNLFDLAAKQLEKQKFGFLKVGGFKNLLIHDEGFAPVLKKNRF
jgi:hypothetical protein